MIRWLDRVCRWWTPIVMRQVQRWSAHGRASITAGVFVPKTSFTFSLRGRVAMVTFSPREQKLHAILNTHGESH
jgi:hypothetical protein